MKLFAFIAPLVSIFISFTASGAAITTCQLQQLQAVQLTMQSDGDLNRVFAGGFSEIKFGIDDVWNPTIRVAASVSPNAMPCWIEYWIDETGPEVLGCSSYRAHEIAMSCPDRCKSCGLVLGRP